VWRGTPCEESVAHYHSDCIGCRCAIGRIVIHATGTGGGEVPTASPTLVLMAETESANSDAMDHFIENLSDEELQELAELSETDIFLF